MSSFDDLALAVASYGGRNKVIFDDVGKPSIMVGVPKMTYGDIITGGGDTILPWWKVDSEEKEVIWVSKFTNIVINGRGYSLPLKDPHCYVNFDNALQYCRAKGNGWHLLLNGVYTALVLRAEKNGTIPRGNTNWGKSYEKSWERGITTYVDGDHDGGRTATGSGPVTWYDDHTPAGVDGLCGNTWEWVAGARTNDGEFQIIPEGNAMKNDCSMAAGSTEWKAIMPDGSLVAPGTSGTLKIDGTSATGTPRINTTREVITTDDSNSYFRNQYFKNVVAKEGVNIPNILIAAGFAPPEGMTSPGCFYARNNGERLPYRGSSFSYTSNGGPAALSLHSTRSNSNYNLSFRSAYEGETEN